MNKLIRRYWIEVLFMTLSIGLVTFLVKTLLDCLP